MARTKSISSIETEIEKVKSEMSRIQERYDALAERLGKLQEEHRQYESEQILKAYAQSGKSYKEVMTFLGV